MVSTYQLNDNLESVPLGNQTWLASWEIPELNVDFPLPSLIAEGERKSPKQIEQQIITM